MVIKNALVNTRTLVYLLGRLYTAVPPSFPLGHFIIRLGN